MIKLSRHKLLFVNAPKCAGTSLKFMLYDYLDEHRKESEVHIGNRFSAQRFDKNLVNKCDGYYKFCVVRDPIDKLISCYNNRVIDKKVLYKRDKFFLKGLTPTPTFDQFLQNLHMYQKASPDIMWHSRKLVYFMGTDEDIYDDIFDISEVNTRLIPILEDKLQSELKKPVKNKTIHKVITKNKLTDAQIKRIRQWYRKDYEIYGHFFNK